MTYPRCKTHELFYFWIPITCATYALYDVCFYYFHLSSVSYCLSLSTTREVVSDSTTLNTCIWHKKMQNMMAYVELM